MSKFVKNEHGEWYLDSTGCYVGTGREGCDNFYDHLIKDGDMTLSDVIDHIMESVNDVLLDEEG